MKKFFIIFVICILPICAVLADDNQAQEIYYSQERQNLQGVGGYTDLPQGYNSAENVFNSRIPMNISTDVEGQVRQLCRRVYDYWYAHNLAARGAENSGFSCDKSDINVVANRVSALLDSLQLMRHLENTTDCDAHFTAVPCPSDVNASDTSKAVGNLGRFNEKTGDGVTYSAPFNIFSNDSDNPYCIQSKDTNNLYFSKGEFVGIYNYSEDSKSASDRDGGVNTISVCLAQIRKSFGQISTNDSKSSMAKVDISNTDDKKLTLDQAKAVDNSGFVGNDIKNIDLNDGKDLSGCCGVVTSQYACTKPGVIPTGIKNRFQDMIRDSNGADCNWSKQSKEAAKICNRFASVCAASSNGGWTNTLQSQVEKLTSMFDEVKRTNYSE